MKGSDGRTEAEVAALQALGLLPKGGLTPIQWKVMRALRHDQTLTPRFLEKMRQRHKFFDSQTVPVLVERGLMTTHPFAITADGLILMRHLEIEARSAHWARGRRLT